MQQGIDNLGKIREILLGEYQTSIEARLSHVENNLNEQFERLNAEVRAITNSLSDQIKQNETRQRELNEDRYNAMMTQMGDLDAQLLHKITETENQLAQELQTYKQEVSESGASVEAKVVDLKTTIAQQEHSLQEKIRASELAVTQEQEKIKAAHEQLNHAHEQLRTEKEALQQSHEMLRNEKEELKTSHEQLRSEKEVLQQSHEQLRSEKEVLQQSHEQLRAEKNQLQSEQEQLKNTLEAHCELSKKAQEQANGFTQALIQVQEDLLLENESNMLSVSSSVANLEKVVANNGQTLKADLAKLMTENAHKYTVLDKRQQEMSAALAKDVSFVRTQVATLDKVMNTGRASVEQTIRHLRNSIKEELSHVSTGLESSKVNKNDLSIMLQQLASQIAAEE